MKKLYILLAAFVAISTAANAQNAITACKSGDTLNILFDVSRNCTPAGRDTLGSRTRIGFHSGANDFAAASTIAWDNATARRATRYSGTGATAKFAVLIPNVRTYYGLTAAPTNVKFVFNDGITNAGSPWNFEGKDGTPGACSDFVATWATLATCTTIIAGTQDLRAEVQVSISPNPMNNEVSYLNISNPTAKTYDVSLMDLVGRTVRTYNSVNGNNVEIQKGNLATGVYFVVVRDAEGRSLTEKLVIR
jgi:Secretion system C-terminal sorting domain